MRDAFRKTTNVLLDPNRRYSQARLFHAIRVALALLVSIALTTGIHIPHGEWASITVLVVIGGLQHHGNIRRRAAERGVGTLLGAMIGLILIVQQSYLLHWPLLTYVLMALVCGYCAYHAIGKGGYIALLTAITVVITAGHGDQDVYDALWRTVDVLIGTVVALVFSFALPAYASYSWRVKLAALLRASAAVHARVQRGGVDPATLQKDMLQLGMQLVQLRSLIPSVAKETDVPTAQLEEIQHAARVCISALELMAAVDANADHPREDDHGIRSTMLALADSLESGSAPETEAPAEGHIAAGAIAAASGSNGTTTGATTGSFAFLTRRLDAELARTREVLTQMSSKYEFPYASN